MNGWQQPVTGQDWFRGMEGRMRRIERHKHGINGMMAVDPIDASHTSPTESQLSAKNMVPEGLSYEGVLSNVLPDVPMEFGSGLSFTISTAGADLGSQSRSSFFLKGPVNDFEALGSLTENEIGDTRYVDADGNLYWWDGLFWQDGGHIQGSPGPAGEPGLGINLKGSVADPSQLPSSAEPNDAYVSEETGHLWVWDGVQWVDVGNIKGPQGDEGKPGPRGPQGIIRVLPPVGSMDELPTDAKDNDLIYVENTGALYGWSTASQNWDVIGYIKGETGPAGKDGETGTGMVLVGTVDTREDLPAAGAEVGEAYLVEATSEFAIWGSDGAWHFVAGVQGPQGSPGPAGERGPVGIGIPGRDGEDGINGLSAYEIFIEQGGEGTEEDWLASLQGPPGKDAEGGGIEPGELLPAIDLILGELIDTQDGNTLVLGENEQRLYAPPTLLPGVDGVSASNNDWIVKAADAYTGQLPGMRVGIENNNSLYDLKVMIDLAMWVQSPVNGPAMFAQPVAVAPLDGWTQVFGSQARFTGGAAFQQIRARLVGRVSAGKSIAFDASVWLQGGGATPIRYVQHALIPLNYELRGSSTIRNNNFPPIGQPPPVPAATTTSLAISPATVVLGTKATFTATISPATAAGRVQFQYQTPDNVWVNFGAPTIVSGGKAAVANAHGYTCNNRAIFTANDADKFKNSTSSSVRLTVNPKVTEKTATNSPGNNRVGTFKGSGAPMTWNWDGRRCYYGYYDSGNGNQRSMALFEQSFINAMRSWPANSIFEATVTFTNLHTYANSGSTMRLQMSGSTSIPDSMGDVSTVNAWTVTVPKSGSVTTKVPANLLEALRTATGFSIGAINSGSAGYGYLDGKTIKVAVKYRA